MNELDPICTGLVSGLIGASIVVVPVLVYRWIAGIPLLPECKTIDAGNRKDRNMLMGNVVAYFAFSAFCFSVQLPICGCATSLMGVLSIIIFEHFDRKLGPNQSDC